MSEAPVTKREMQEGLDVLQSAINDGIAFQNAAIKGLEEAVKDVESLPDDMQEEFRKIRTTLGTVVAILKQYGQFHQGTAKVLKFILEDLDKRGRS